MLKYTTNQDFDWKSLGFLIERNAKIFLAKYTTMDETQIHTPLKKEKERNTGTWSIMKENAPNICKTSCIYFPTSHEEPDRWLRAQLTLTILSLV